MATSQFSILVLLSPSLTPLSSSQRCHPNDEKTLLQIQNYLSYPAALITWQPNTDCCNWSAVECDGKISRVIRLDLYLPIPAAVGELSHLRSLTLYRSSLIGEIPRAVSKLSELTFLDLRFNFLTGQVPSFLGHLKKLIFLGLSDNYLKGRFNSSIAFAATSAQCSFLSQKQAHRKHSGIIFWFKDLNLYLSDNNLTGPIPTKLGSTNFSYIDVSRNELEGDISFLFGSDKRLYYGDFSSNQFQFDLSNVVFSRTLTNLYLSHNKIYGSLPKDLVKNRIDLNVSYNQFCGPIPAGGAAMLEKLNSSSFSNNKCLCGAPLPKCK